MRRDDVRYWPIERERALSFYQGAYQVFFLSHGLIFQGPFGRQSESGFPSGVLE